MTCLFSSIKEIFTGQPLISFQGGACKAIKSVFIDPYTRLADSNNSFLLLSAKTYRIRKKKGLISDFGVQPFLDIFELPHLKVNHEQKYTFLRTADIWPVYKVLKQGQDSSN